MNAFSVEQAQDLLKRHERRLMARGHSLESARAKIADGLGVAPGTLENVRRGRVKISRAFRAFGQDLCSYVAGQIADEIGLLSHEFEMVRKGRSDVDPASLSEAENLVKKARALLEEGLGR